MPSSGDTDPVGRTLTLGGGAESSVEGKDIELSVSLKDIHILPYDLCSNRSSCCGGNGEAATAPGRVPAIAMPGRASQGGAGMPADPDRRVGLLHRQTKGAETDMLSLPPPRHISTLPILRIRRSPPYRRSAPIPAVDETAIGLRDQTQTGHSGP
jgi:hypothetical protein